MDCTPKIDPTVFISKVSKISYTKFYVGEGGGGRILYVKFSCMKFSKYLTLSVELGNFKTHSIFSTERTFVEILFEVLHLVFQSIHYGFARFRRFSLDFPVYFIIPTFAIYFSHSIQPSKYIFSEKLNSYHSKLRVRRIQFDLVILFELGDNSTDIGYWVF